MMLPPLTFMMDSTMNLISELHHKYERKKNIITCTLKIPKNYPYCRCHYQTLLPTPIVQKVKETLIDAKICL